MLQLSFLCFSTVTQNALQRSREQRRPLVSDLYLDHCSLELCYMLFFPLINFKLKY